MARRFDLKSGNEADAWDWGGVVLFLVVTKTILVKLR